MSYRLKRSESVASGVRRIAREQLVGAIRELQDDQVDQHEFVHRFRKHCKKLRGMLRLVRTPLGDTGQAENERYRDAARRLSSFRDADSLITALDQLRTEAPDARASLEQVRAVLTDRRTQLADQSGDLESQLSELPDWLTESLNRVDHWTFSAHGWKAIQGGLARSYERGRRALRVIEAGDPTDEEFHDLRKRVKDHWYQMRLLSSLWPPVIKVRARQLRDLSELLGNDHDLSVLRQTLASNPESFGSDRDIGHVMLLMTERRDALRQSIVQDSQRVYADKTRAFVRRFRILWSVWRDE